MARSREGRIQNSRVKLWMVASLMASLLLFLVIGAQAQTYKVIYNFSGQRDGGHPGGNMAIDRAGNLYGVASDYGYYSVGDIFKLAPKQGGWLLSLIYTFTASSDGAYPDGITMAPDGSLYGATLFRRRWRGLRRRLSRTALAGASHLGLAALERVGTAHLRRIRRLRSFLDRDAG